MADKQGDEKKIEPGKPLSKDEGKMTIWEHLDELRKRLVRSVIAYIIGASIAWTYRDPILAWLWKPFAASWRAEGIGGDPALNFAAPSDAFKAYLKLSLTGGLLFSAPVIFYELWSFIAPGLYKKEKKVIIPFVFFSSVLFVGGGLFGWRVAFPVTFSYFLPLAGGAQTSGVTIHPVVMIGEYLDFVSQMLLAFGIVFELPLFILFLSIAGIVNYLQLIRFGRWFILVAFTVGAIITPPDTTSQIVMSVPLCLLYFVSIGLAFLFGKRPSKEEIAKSRAEREKKKLAKKARDESKRRAKQAQKESERLAKEEAKKKKSE
jgi:sec-independent protein translocase protein TatC